MSHWLEITTKIGCSSRCEYCPQDKLIRQYIKKSRETIMSFETFKKCISTVPKKIEIHFTGFCEPFLNPNVIDFIAHALDKGHNILINTTLKGMVKTDVDRLRRIIIEDKEWGGPVTVHLPCIEFKSNIVDNNFYKILEYLIRNLPGTRFHAHGTPIKKIEDFIKSVDSGAWIKKRNIHSRAGNVEFKDTSRLRKKGNCSRVWDHVILPNGDAYLCCADYGLEIKVGNLLKSSYDEIHNTELFRNIIRNGTSICSRCEF